MHMPNTCTASVAIFIAASPAKHLAKEATWVRRPYLIYSMPRYSNLAVGILVYQLR